MLLLFGDFVIRFFPTISSAIALILIGASLSGCDREKQASEQAYEGDANHAASQDAENSGTTDMGAYHIMRGFKGREAPEAAFTNAAGGKFSLQDFRGKPVLLNIWATWCAPCVAEMPMLDALAQSAEDRLQVIAVSQDIQGAAIVEPWIQKAGLKKLPIFMDPDNGLLDVMNSALPTTVLYDGEGREIWRVIGPLDWNGPEAAKLLEEAA